jgi:LysM repeat protein
VVEATPTRPTLVPELAQPPAGPGVVTAGLPGRRAAAVGRQRSAPARAAGSRPARLTRRGRLVLATLATFAVAGVLMALGPTVAHLGPAAAVPANAPAVVVVQPGDTLWSIARRVAPDRDARLVVADLRRLNSLPTADLEVGQRLQVGRG